MKRIIIACLLLAGCVKPQLGGVADRAGEPRPSSYYPSVVNAFVVKDYDTTRSYTTWAELQPTQGGPIATNNTIDQAINNVRGTDVRLKLRIYAGFYAPEWTKNLPVTSGQPGPITICDVNDDDSECGTIGHIWEQNYRSAYRDFMAKLAAKYDATPEILEVAITGCSTAFGEPFMRQGENPQNLANYIEAGYDEAKNKDCERDQITAHNTWETTRSSLALSPYQEFVGDRFRTNTTFTEQMMDYCRAALAERCVLGNHSIGARNETIYPCSDIDGSDWTTRERYSRMYTKIKCLGAPIYFQTATAAKIANNGLTLSQVLTRAANLGAGMVELPSGYNQESSTAYTTVENLRPLDASLEQNAQT